MPQTTLPLPPLDWLRSFEAAARLSNFTAAAAELGLTQAAVSQHIRSLEERLKQPLFIRLPRGVELTPEGGAYLPHLQSAFATIANSTRELLGPRTIRDRHDPLADFFRRADDRAETAANGHGTCPSSSCRSRPSTPRPTTASAPAGSTLRLGPGSSSFPGRQADRLTRETLTPMAAPGLAKVSDWTALPRLTVVGAREMWGEWFAVARMKPTLGPTHKFDSFVTALEAAKHGAGMVLGSRPLADAALRDGSLVTLSGFALSSGAGHYLTAPSGAHLSPAEEAVRRWFATVSSAPRFPDKSLNTDETIGRRDAGQDLPRYCARPDVKLRHGSARYRRPEKKSRRNSMLDTAATKTLSDLLERFGAALASGDIETAVGQFQEECYWRDLVTFTWNIKTMEGRDQVRDMLKSQLAATRPSGWALAEGEDVVAATASSKGGSASRPTWRAASATSGEERPDLDAAHHDGRTQGPRGADGIRPAARSQAWLGKGRKTWKEEREQEAAELGFTRSRTA